MQSEPTEKNAASLSLAGLARPMHNLLTHQTQNGPLLGADCKIWNSKLQDSGLKVWDLGFRVLNPEA